MNILCQRRNADFIRLLKADFIVNQIIVQNSVVSLGWGRVLAYDSALHLKRCYYKFNDKLNGASQLRRCQSLIQTLNCTVVRLLTADAAALTE